MAATWVGNIMTFDAAGQSFSAEAMDVDFIVWIAPTALDSCILAETERGTALFHRTADVTDKDVTNKYDRLSGHVHGGLIVSALPSGTLEIHLR